MDLLSFLSTTGAKVLSRSAQKNTLGGLPPPSQCTAQCYGGGTVSCSGKGDCSAHDGTGPLPGQNGYCQIGGDSQSCN